VAGIAGISGGTGSQPVNMKRETKKAPEQGSGAVWIAAGSGFTPCGIDSTPVASGEVEARKEADWLGSCVECKEDEKGKQEGSGMALAPTRVVPDAE
jgi:hypothetical protein